MTGLSRFCSSLCCLICAGRPDLSGVDLKAGSTELQIFLEKMERKKSKVSEQQPADEVNFKEQLEILGRAQEIEKKVAIS